MHLWHTIYTFRCVWVLPTHSQEAPPSQHGFAVVPENVHELLFRFETGFEISRVHSKLVHFGVSYLYGTVQGLHVTKSLKN